jgi:hypothetical protein
MNNERDVTAGGEAIPPEPEMRTTTASPSAAGPTSRTEPPMAGAANHLDPSVLPMLSESKGRRIQHILSDRLIIYKALRVILNRIDWLVQEPRNTRARGEIYVGPPGSGKSSISLLVRMKYPLDARDVDGVRQPKAVAISISGARTTKAVLNRVLKAMGVPTTARSIGDLELVVIDTLVRANIRILIIDELQDLRQLRENEQLRVMETIKNLMNEAKLPVLGLGDGRAEQAFDADPHLKARFSFFSIPAWSEGAEFGEFLTALEKRLPLQNRSDLARPEIQKTLLKKCGALLDGMVRRIKAAAVQAVVDGGERIMPDLLENEPARPSIDNLTCGT